MTHRIQKPVEAIVTPLVSLSPQMLAHMRPLPEPDIRIMEKAYAAIAAEEKYEVISGAINAIDHLILRRIPIHDALTALKQMQEFPSLREIGAELSALIHAEGNEINRNRLRLRAAINLLSEEMQEVRQALARAYSTDYASIMSALNEAGFDTERHSSILNAASSRAKMILTLPEGGEVSLQDHPNGMEVYMEMKYREIRSAIFIIHNRDDVLAALKEEPSGPSMSM